MSEQENIRYRLKRAEETLSDAKLLAENERWASFVNRLYYACYYAISALLLSKNIDAHTHSGVKTAFNKYFIKSKIIPEKYGILYSQLFVRRHKGDYADLFYFNKNDVIGYLEPVTDLIKKIEEILKDL